MNLNKSSQYSIVWMCNLTTGTTTYNIKYDSDTLQKFASIFRWIKNHLKSTRWDKRNFYNNLTESIEYWPNEK